MLCGLEIVVVNEVQVQVYSCCCIVVVVVATVFVGPTRVGPLKVLTTANKGTKIYTLHSV